MNKEIINPKLKKTAKKELKWTADNVIALSTFITALTNLINTIKKLWEWYKKG